ncbi:coproporphyrinogen III oxidase [Clostridiales bacterium CHKCI001]|nr:coproporphyrinogen III oxidase [Clostridiales bacterium CHKCI001]
MRRWGEKPYYSFNYYLQQTFGCKVYKVALNAGMSCPNRDGKIGTGGCIFCSAGGSGDFAGDQKCTITEQIEQGITGTSKFHANAYVAYFQAYTNTYASVKRLRAIFTEAIQHPKVAAISIATRPDCLDEEKIELLAELNQVKPVWIELGLQTIWEETAFYIRRGYKLSCFEDACSQLRKKGLTVIVHVILGLPNETKEQMLATIHYLNHQDIQGIKLQLLHVLKGTDLALDYEAGNFQVLEEEEYVSLVVDCIERISPEIVIHRLTGDGPKDLLIAPLWSTRKMQVLNEIHHELKIRNTWQGRILEV